MKTTFQLGTIFGSESSMPPHKKSNDKDAAAERRSEARHGERVPVQFFVGDQAMGHQGVLINGSDAGCFIETNKTLPLLTQIRIEGPGLTCRAVVVRVHWLGPEERVTRSSGMALRLLSRKDHNRGTVLSFSQKTAAK